MKCKYCGGDGFVHQCVYGIINGIEAPTQIGCKYCNLSGRVGFLKWILSFFLLLTHNYGREVYHHFNRTKGYGEKKLKEHGLYHKPYQIRRDL